MYSRFIDIPRNRRQNRLWQIAIEIPNVQFYRFVFIATLISGGFRDIASYSSFTDEFKVLKRYNNTIFNGRYSYCIRTVFIDIDPLPISDVWCYQIRTQRSLKIVDRVPIDGPTYLRSCALNRPKFSNVNIHFIMDIDPVFQHTLNLGMCQFAHSI